MPAVEISTGPTVDYDRVMTDGELGYDTEIESLRIGDGLSTGGTALNRFIPSGAGAVETNIPDQLKQTVFVHNYRDNSDPDDTNAFTRALAAAKCVRVVVGKGSAPDGAYVVDQIVVSSDRTVHTDGLATIIRQTDVGHYDKPVVLVQGSRVTLGALTIEGNIDLDTGEWNHAVGVYGGTHMRDVRLGDIHGRNIRGDILYVGGTPQALVERLTVGRVTGENILRSGASIVGGTVIHIEAVDTGHCGYTTLDIEPNGTDNQICDDIRIGTVRGGKVQLAGNGGNIIGKVQIDLLHLDSALQTEPVPPYLQGNGNSYFDKDFGVAAHNFHTLEIGNFECRDKLWSAIWSIENPADAGSIAIRQYTGRQNGLNNLGVGELNIPGCNHLRIDRVDTLLPHKDKYFVVGAGTETSIYIGEGSRIAGGRVAAGVGQSHIAATVEAPDDAELLFAGVSRSTIAIKQTGLTDPGSGIFYQCEKNVLFHCELDAAKMIHTGNDEHVMLMTTFGGTFYPFGFTSSDFRSGNLSAGLGGNAERIWWDRHHRLRTVTGPYPTPSDLDGTVVGLQS